MPIEFESLRDDFGAIVHGVDLSQPLSDVDLGCIREAHVHHGLLIFRGQHLEPEHEIAFARVFNKIRVYIGNDETKLPGHPEINVLGNVVENGRPVGFQTLIGYEWHTDGTGFPYPPVATVLYCLETPGRGGETLFASGRRAWEELPASHQRRLAPMKVEYSFRSLHAKLNVAAGTGKTLSTNELARSPDVVHPLVRTHCVTGKKSLWFTQAEMQAFVGLSPADSRSLGEEVVSLISRPEYVYAHRWQPFDLLVWDNRWMHHSTTPYTYAHARRRLHRVSGEGDEVPV